MIPLYHNKKSCSSLDLQSETWSRRRRLKAWARLFKWTPPSFDVRKFLRNQSGPEAGHFCSSFNSLGWSHRSAQETKKCGIVWPLRGRVFLSGTHTYTLDLPRFPPNFGGHNPTSMQNRKRYTPPKNKNSRPLMLSITNIKRLYPCVNSSNHFFFFQVHQKGTNEYLKYFCALHYLFSVVTWAFCLKSCWCQRQERPDTHGVPPTHHRPSNHLWHEGVGDRFRSLHMRAE